MSNEKAMKKLSRVSMVVKLLTLMELIWSWFDNKVVIILSTIVGCQYETKGEELKSILPRQFMYVIVLWVP